MITLPELRQKTPREFEEYIAKLLPKLGYSKVYLTPYTSDSGYDIKADKKNNRVLFECKRYSNQNKVGSRDVRIFADACRRLKADSGIFITTSNFTRTVEEEQKSRSIPIEFWNGKELIKKIKNTKKVKAYCINCKRELNRYYITFDFKIKVQERFASLEKRDPPRVALRTSTAVSAMNSSLVPTGPRLCSKCKFFAKCSECNKEIDTRKRSSHRILLKEDIINKSESELLKSIFKDNKMSDDEYQYYLLKTKELKSKTNDIWLCKACYEEKKRKEIKEKFFTKCSQCNKEIDTRKSSSHLYNQKWLYRDFFKFYRKMDKIFKFLFFPIIPFVFIILIILFPSKMTSFGILIVAMSFIIRFGTMKHK